ncbi:MFS transporter [Psychrobacter sp. JCM 18900]|uniref:MFS transporter n=1 Tax=Psychrobacter sp. JCM 18900 TaxID=1298608 RepID=UPI0021C40D06|nr:MFS transporter [Psychrobacter sp. JCM 18900]
MITTSVNIQGPLYAVYAHNDGYGVLATTIAFSFYVLGVIPVLLAFGGLSDRIGRRKVILISLALSVAATALMLFYPYTRALAVARFILGVGTALMAATATAYMIELLGSSDTMRATAWVTASTTIGFGLGPVLTTVSLMFYETDQPASFFLTASERAARYVFVISITRDGT